MDNEVTGDLIVESHVESQVEPQGTVQPMAGFISPGRRSVAKHTGQALESSRTISASKRPCSPAHLIPSVHTVRSPLTTPVPVRAVSAPQPQRSQEHQDPINEISTKNAFDTLAHLEEGEIITHCDAINRKGKGKISIVLGLETPNPPTGTPPRSGKVGTKEKKVTSKKGVRVG